MQQSVDDASHRENPSYNGADIDQKLEKVLLRVGVVDSHGRYLVVEKNQVLMIIVVQLVSSRELESFSGENAPIGMISFKL